MTALWTSIASGLFVGVVYAVLALTTARLAARQEGARFFDFFLGGMAVRMLVTLVATGAVLALVPPAAPVAFGLTVAALILAGLAAEVALLLRLAARPA
jgi:hypothetical protein